MTADPTTERLPDAAPGRAAPQRSRDGLVELAAEATSLRGLVRHRGSVDHDMRLEEVRQIFEERRVDFLAITSAGAVSGVCSRLCLGALLGSRFGFALHSRSGAHLAQVAHPLVFSETMPVRKVLDTALARQGDEFHEDVVLVDAQHNLLGLIPVDALARLQSKLVSDQLAELRRQHLGLFQAQHALRQSHGLYLGLFENHALGVALLDPQGVLLEHNARLAELLRIEPGAARGGSLVSLVAEPERAGFLSVLRKLADGGGMGSTQEITLSIPRAGARVFRFSCGWIRETGQICACLDDMTEQKSVERHLVRQEKQGLLDTLVGGIAHELNNKLTPVQGFAELIAVGSDGDTKQYADLITQCVGEAATIIRQLLQLSKPAPVSDAAQTVDLRTVVDDALSMLRFETRESRCTVKKTFEREPVWVRAAPAQLKQVLMNLALNALHAMSQCPLATMEVSVSVVDGLACVTVADNGVGIAAENLSRVFDPFFTTKGPEQGTGLGLSVCYSIVRQHGGEISVESAPGSGASFTVSLPREVPALQSCLLSEAPDQRSPEFSGGRGLRVLLVDDERVIRHLIQEVLSTQFGCHVDSVQSGLEAMERLAWQEYALVISDIRMPEMNGTELFLALREAQPALARRFILLTGHRGDKVLEAEIEQWGVPLLAKPFSIRNLTEICAPFLRTATPVPAAEPSRLAH